MTDTSLNLVRKIERHRAQEARRNGIRLRVPSGPAVERRDLLRSRGMSDTAIAAACELHQTTVSGIHKRPSLAASTEAAIFSVPVPHEFNPGDAVRVDKTGTTRRLRAMVAAGYSQAFIAERVETDPDVIVRLTREGPHKDKPNRYVTGAMFKAVRAVYDELAFKDPAAFGIAQHEITRSINRSTHLDWAPPHCWDDDTIDDPEAIAEWTGACGSDTGARIHRRDGIPMCQPCHEALLAYRREENERRAARRGAA
ncbi:hypothetical protein [Streptomyces sp. NPDC093261]|uniref:hypothetical protein n=1 Tax=Streptomyces sp. NPDC093261 TaxID=3366037 RepID=UPI00380719FB